MVPRIDRVHRSLTPIKGLVRGVIGRPIDKYHEFFILGSYEALPNAVADKFAERVVEGENVDEDDSCDGEK